MRARRARWVIFWVFAVAVAPLTPLAFGTYPPVGVLVGVITVVFLGLQVRLNRREDRREAARVPHGSGGELSDHWTALRTEPGRMPEGHGPGDPEVELALDELPGADEAIPEDAAGPQA